MKNLKSLLTLSLLAFCLMTGSVQAQQAQGPKLNVADLQCNLQAPEMTLEMLNNQLVMLQFQAGDARSSSATLVRWDISDVTHLYGNTVMHKFQAPGNYMITMTLIGKHCTSSSSKSISIRKEGQAGQIAGPHRLIGGQQ